MRVNRFSLVMGAALFYTCVSSINGQNQDAKGKEQNRCSCVPYFLCKDGTIVSNSTVDSSGGNGKGEDLESIAAKMHLRIGEEEAVGEGFGEGGCNHYLEKCCVIHTDPTTPTPPTTERKHKCGNRQVTGANRIAGIDAEYGEFPWMVALLDKNRVGSTTDGNNVGLECGGSIINYQVILTAAHCIKQSKTLIVRAGEWDIQTQTDEERFPVQERNVKQIIIHENYYSDGLVNDIALLVLDSPLEPSEVVSPICLPDQDEIMDNRSCVVTGWGKDSIRPNGTYQVILRKIDVPVLLRDPCMNTLQETRLGKYFRLDESFICAGGEPEKDSCKGDGGGPLACPMKGNPQLYVQAGIVSWGLNCGTHVPGVYVNVPRFIGWINDKLTSLGLS